LSQPTLSIGHESRHCHTIEVAVSGQTPVTRAFAERVKAKLEQIDTLRMSNSDSCSTTHVEVNVDRERRESLERTFHRFQSARARDVVEPIHRPQFLGRPWQRVAYQVQVQIRNG